MDKLVPSDSMVNGHCIRNWKFDASFRIELAGVSYACFVLSSFSLNFPTQLQFRWKNIWESILFHEFFRNLSMRNKILRTTRIYDFQKRNTIKKRHWSFIPLRRNSKKSNTMPRTKSIPLIHANSCPSQPVAVKSIDKKPRLTPSVSRQRCNPRNVTHSSSISNHFAPHDLPSTLSKRYIYIHTCSKSYFSTLVRGSMAHESSRPTFSLHYLRVYSLDHPPRA